MATINELRSEIQIDMVRDDLSDQIDQSIISAIREVQTEPVAFNSDVDTSESTTTGAATMSLPTGFFRMKKLQLTINGTLCTLEEKTQDEIMELRTAGTTSQPYAYAIFDSLIQFNCLAADDYNATISYYRTFTLPTVGGTESHTWITNAYSLIKYQAKSILYANVLFDWENAKNFGIMAREELERLKRVFNTQSSGSSMLALN